MTQPKTSSRTIVLLLWSVSLLAGFRLAGCQTDNISGGDTLPDGGYATCAANGSACGTNADCCLGSCMAGMCSGGTCAASGKACNAPTDCCNLDCVKGTCGSAQCTTTGQTCTANADCCSFNCVTGTCQPIVAGGCTTVGNTCTANSQCCSNVCSASGKCSSTGGATGCYVTGDICFRGADCCTNLCTIPAGKTAGTCSALPTGGVGGCAVDGEACTAGSSCCSRVCIPTATGGHVCATASGCRVKGDLCKTDNDCCGGPNSGLCGQGEVTCAIVPGTNPPTGRCSTPTSASQGTPEGDVCGQSQSSRENCCGGCSPKQDCCKLDSNNIYRCYAGGSTTCPTGYTGQAPCCIAAGAVCSFSSECCGNAPCVPGADGVLRCATMCVPPAGVCTSTGDCCTGYTCLLQPGAAKGTCGIPPTGSGGSGTDMGTAPMCGIQGQSCSTTSPCCANYFCAPPSGTTCTAGTLGCACFPVVG